MDTVNGQHFPRFLGIDKKKTSVYNSYVSLGSSKHLTFYQCFESGSALILVGWSRIRIQGAKMTHKIEKGKKFDVLKCWMFSFGG
jgi:hypothetical protein